jgi:hypothetical protein
MKLPFLRIYTSKTHYWMQFTVLFLLTMAAQSCQLLYQYLSSQGSASFNVFATVLFLSGLTIPAILLGLKLGKPLNLGVLNDTARLSDGLKFAMVGAVLLASSLLALRWLLTPYLPAELPEYGFRGPLGGLLVSFGAAVGEEIWFRLGLMTLLLYLCSKTLATAPLSNKVAVSVIVLVAFGFGVAHLPYLNASGAADSAAIWATIIGNMGVSGLYGWCYWRYGLLSAIFAHFTVDIVLHMLPAFF